LYGGAVRLAAAAKPLTRMGHPRAPAGRHSPAMAATQRTAPETQPRDVTLGIAQQIVTSLPWPLLLMDAELRIAGINVAAEGELRRLDARIERRTIQFASQATCRRFNSLLQQTARQTSTGQQRRGPVAKGAHLRSPVCDCVLTDGAEIPIAWASAHPISGVSQVMVALYPLTRTRPLSSDLLRRRLNLTPAESRVAALALTHPRISDLAAGLRLSPNTVKNHLKSTFAKCRVRNRAEFVALLCAVGQ
jgi:DNA-binding CsgD family transcriptional regulator